MGVALLKASGYLGELPNVTQAALIGAVGHAVLIGVQHWRFQIAAWLWQGMVSQELYVGATGWLEDFPDGLDG